MESYSIKQLERFYGFIREEPLEEARKSLLCLERLIELDERDAVTNETKLSVERYNRDDCLSTWRLREWLESLRQIHPLKDSLTRPPIVPGAASDNTQMSPLKRRCVLSSSRQISTALQPLLSNERDGCWHTSSITFDARPSAVGGITSDYVIYRRKNWCSRENGTVWA